MDAPEEKLASIDEAEDPVNLNEQYPGDVEQNHEEAERYYGEIEQNQWKTEQNYEEIEHQGDIEENYSEIEQNQEEIEQGFEEIEQNQGEIKEHYDNIENNKGDIEQKQHEQENHDELGAGVANIDKRWPGWPGDTVFRILVPAQKVGGIIGRKGEFIKKMCEETKARIKILDGPPGDPERAVMISAKEDQNASISPAMDGLLCVHKRIVDLDAESATYPPIAGNMIRTRLLVPASQAGSLIGKHGATIKSIQEASSCVLRIVEDLPLLALHDDRVVEIQGGWPTGVHRAVELVAGQLRKFLVDHSVLPLFEIHTSKPNAHVEQNFPPRPQSWGLPQGLPQNTGPGGYGSNPAFLPPRPPRDSFYPMLDLPPLEKQPHHGVSAYGREAPHMGGHSATIDPPPGTTSQVTHHMQVPLSYADAVIGTSGANISYIRRASGATITIQETRGVPSEMTVEINGSATQVQIAQQLIQNFMAEAGATSQNPAPPADQGYSSYQSQGYDRYMSAPSNAGPGGHSAAGYGSGYGSNYGY